MAVGGCVPDALAVADVIADPVAVAVVSAARPDAAADPVTVAVAVVIARADATIDPVTVALDFELFIGQSLLVQLRPGLVHPGLGPLALGMLFGDLGLGPLALGALLGHVGLGLTGHSLRAVRVRGLAAT